MASPGGFFSSSLWRRLGQALVLLLVAFVVYRVVQHLDTLQQYPWHFSPLLALGGLGLLAVANSVMPFVWRDILARTGEQISADRAYYAWALSRMGRYIPGKVWVVLGRVYLVPEGRRGRVLWSVTVEMMLDLMAGLAWGLLTLPALTRTWIPGMPQVPPWGPLLVLLAFFLALHPAVLRMVLRRLGRDVPDVAWDYRHLLAWFLLFLSIWALRVFGHYLFLRSFGLQLPYATLLTAFALAWILGLLAPFAPGGLGVREGVLTVVLEPVLGPGLAPLAALITRLAATLGDLLLLLPVAFLHRRFARPRRGP